MQTMIDWRKLKRMPLDEDKAFEEFCFHITSIRFGEYGTIGYFYNTPGSEFYVELNKLLEYNGVQYQAGEVIGLQAKYWRGNDEDNSPLPAKHIEELKNGFTTSLKYRPSLKLWIVCTPGEFVQAQWDKLTSQLKTQKNDCQFEHWHRTIFEDFYMRESNSYNGIYHYYFGTHFIGKEELVNQTKDALETLKSKFDVELHVPCEYEKRLMIIVNKSHAEEELKSSIRVISDTIREEGEESLLDRYHWGREYLTEEFVRLYKEDINAKKQLSEQLQTYIFDGDILKHIEDIDRLLHDYIEERIPRVEQMNKEIHSFIGDAREKHNNFDFYLSDLIKSIKRIENLITKHSDESWSLEEIVACVEAKTHSIFAEAGYGKTHFACSIAENMLSQGLPILLLTGSMFRECQSVEKKILEIVGASAEMNFSDWLDSMDFLGKTCNCQIPIVIDGLNETAPNDERWKAELPALCRKIKAHNNIILITTCREKSEYLKAIYDCEQIKELEDWNPILLHGISSNDIVKTVRKYFAKYNIGVVRESRFDLFKNPLLLKIFCIVNKDRQNIDVSGYSITSCMHEYRRKLVAEIAGTQSGADVRQHRIEQKLNTIAQILWERNSRTIDYYDDFSQIFDEEATKFLNEGMCFITERSITGTQVQFSYDLVAGGYIAQHIIQANKTEADFIQFIQNNRTRLWGENRHVLAEDILKNLLYLVPNAYYKEWCIMMPEDDVILTSLENLDILLAKDSGVDAISILTQQKIDNTQFIETICKKVFERVCKKGNIDKFCTLLPFFSTLSPENIDRYWNTLLVDYKTLLEIYSLLHDEYCVNKYDWKDVVALCVMVCGITDNEYREKNYHLLAKYTRNHFNEIVNIIPISLKVRDAFIKESILSALVGVGLRTNNKKELEKVINLLVASWNEYDSNYIILLDYIETLFTLAQTKWKITYDRQILWKNKDEKWDDTAPEDRYPYSFFSYDCEKYNIRQLYQHSYDRSEPIFTKEEVISILINRCIQNGYDKNTYQEIQKNENEVARYRISQRTSYAEKYGQYALKELYGWLIVNKKLEPEFKGTFRTQLANIDPSEPMFRPYKTLVTQSFMPKDTSNLNAWMNRNDSSVMSGLCKTHLNGLDGEWVLLCGYLSQQIKDRYADYHLSCIADLHPKQLSTKQIISSDTIEESDECHVYASELGWRSLETTEEYEDPDADYRMLSRYSFKSWCQKRFEYPYFTCLSSKYAQMLGLRLDINDMVYYDGIGRPASVYYVNEKNHFFYLRKDIVDKMLNIMNAKLRFHIFERRMVVGKLPLHVPTVNPRFIEHVTNHIYS